MNVKAIVAGGRDFKPSQEHLEWLSEVCQRLNVTHIISGGCRGADTLGERFARDNGFDLSVFYAEWDKYGKAAGPMRNRKMAEHADVCILFPGGAGTRSMLKCAKECNLHIEEWKEYQ